MERSDAVQISPSLLIAIAWRWWMDRSIWSEERPPIVSRLELECSRFEVARGKIGKLARGTNSSIFLQPHELPTVWICPTLKRELGSISVKWNTNAMAMLAMCSRISMVKKRWWLWVAMDMEAQKYILWVKGSGTRPLTSQRPCSILKLSLLEKHLALWGDQAMILLIGKTF